MTEQTRGGFTGDPAAAFDVRGTGGCCGTPPRATLALPDPAGAPAAGAQSASPCCGTAAEASGSCCGAEAKAAAVSSGAGCCA